MLAVAASTLVVFALFQPIHRRIQRVVDRRFDRARYDRDRAATAFARGVRDETDLAARRRRARADGRRDPRAGDADESGFANAFNERLRNDVRTTVREDDPDERPRPPVPPPPRPRRARVRGRDGERRPPVRPDDGPVVDIAESDPLLAYLQTAPGTGRARPARARLAGGPRAARGGCRARRPARLAGRADRHAQSRAAAVRAGLLDRRPAPADDPRRPGRAGDPRRPARPRAGRTRPPSASGSSRRCASRRSSSSSSCRASCRTCPNGRSPRTTVRRAPSVATSTTSSRCPTGGSASPSATSPTRACRRRWSWPGRIRSSAPRRAAAIRPARSWPAPTTLLVPEMPARMFVTCLFAILDPTTGRIVLANAGHNLPYIRTDDGVIELRATGMPLGLLPGIRYEETEGGHRSGQQRPALLRRARRGARPGPGDVRLPAPARGDGRATTPGASCSTGCSTPSTGSPARTGSRRTTSRSSPCAEPRAWRREDAR